MSETKKVRSSELRGQEKENSRWREVRGQALGEGPLKTIERMLRFQNEDFFLLIPIPLALPGSFASHSTVVHFPPTHCYFKGVDAQDNPLRDWNKM